MDFATSFTVDPLGTDRALWRDLLAHFGPSAAVEIAVFTAWQANGLRAIHSWDAERLFEASDVPLAYSDGPSLFVPGTGPPARGTMRHLRPEDVVRYPDPNAALAPQDLVALRDAWHAQGSPPGTWLDFLAPAPHVLWGWAEFHRLALLEGLLPVRAKALASALLAVRLGYEAWVARPGRGSAPEPVTERDLDWLRSGDLDRFDTRTAAALRYVDCLETDYLSIDSEFMRQLGRSLSPGHIVELGMFAGLQMGSIRLARLVL